MAITKDQVAIAIDGLAAEVTIDEVTFNEKIYDAYYEYVIAQKNNLVSSTLKTFETLPPQERLAELLKQKEILPEISPDILEQSPFVQFINDSSTVTLMTATTILTTKFIQEHPSYLINKKEDAKREIIREYTSTLTVKITALQNDIAKAVAKFNDEGMRFDKESNIKERLSLVANELQQPASPSTDFSSDADWHYKRLLISLKERLSKAIESAQKQFDLELEQINRLPVQQCVEQTKFWLARLEETATEELQYHKFLLEQLLRQLQNAVTYYEELKLAELLPSQRLQKMQEMVDPTASISGLAAESKPYLRRLLEEKINELKSVLATVKSKFDEFKKTTMPQPVSIKETLAAYEKYRLSFGE